MKVYLISDMHMGHEKINEFEPDRKDSIKLLNEISKLPEGSLLINLGDVVFKKHKYYMENYRFFTRNLNTVLVKGNHDNKSYSWYSEYFDFVCESFYRYVEGKMHLFTHEPKLNLEPNVINVHGHTHGNNHRSYSLDDRYRCIKYHVEKL